MEVKILKENDKELELEVKGDKTIAVLVKAYLVQDERVDFAAFAQEHPLEGKTKLYLRVKEGSPRDVLKSAVERAKADFITFRTAFEEALK
ncbi:MAG: DNA-directed polymerase subunit [Candidatus Diapherotrites archaeon]|nr:DNA-directed polymerase subunit [Candidatus Diapherotrites archaeon]MDN5367041.1 DNA-directed polymerase subunit [Candidatus Diapherotrites archaeon]